MGLDTKRVKFLRVDLNPKPGSSAELETTNSTKPQDWADQTFCLGKRLTC